MKGIKPLTEYCECGKRVLNHHWLCDECYSKKEKAKAIKENKRKLEQQKGNLDAVRSSRKYFNKFRRK